MKGNGVILIIFTGIILTFLTGLTIGFIRRYDHENGIVITKKNRWYFIISFFLLPSMLRIKYGPGIQFYFYSYLVFYLIVCAFVDWQTCHVYDFLHYITIGVGMLYLFLRRNGTGSIFAVLLHILLFSVLMMVCVKKGVLGGGDGLLLVSISFFLLNPRHVFGIEVLLINILLANVVFVMTNLRKFNFKKLRMKEQLPFVPSIAISTCVMVLLVI